MVDLRSSTKLFRNFDPEKIKIAKLMTDVKSVKKSQETFSIDKLSDGSGMHSTAGSVRLGL